MFCKWNVLILLWYLLSFSKKSFTKNFLLKDHCASENLKLLFLHYFFLPFLSESSISYIAEKSCFSKFRFQNFKTLPVEFISYNCLNKSFAYGLKSIFNFMSHIQCLIQHFPLYYSTINAYILMTNKGFGKIVYTVYSVLFNVLYAELYLFFLNLFFCILLYTTSHSLISCFVFTSLLLSLTYKILLNFSFCFKSGNVSCMLTFISIYAMIYKYVCFNIRVSVPCISC